MRNKVRLCILISLRKYTPPRLMFLIHYSRLYRCITFGVIMFSLGIGVSFSSCKTQCGFPQTLSIHHTAKENYYQREKVVEERRRMERRKGLSDH